jgi:hypothetical protein
MNFACRNVVVAMLGIVLSASHLLAGVFSMPTPLPRHEIYSQNRLFVLDVDPEANRNTIYPTADRTRRLWSFDGVLTNDVKQILLANDGAVVALIGGGDVIINDRSGAEGIRLIDRFGATRLHRMAEPRGKPTPGSYGCSGGVASWYSESIDHGDWFVIRTLDGKKHPFDYTTASPHARWWRAGGVAVGVSLLVGLLLVVLARRPPVAAPVANPEAAA